MSDYAKGHELDRLRHGDPKIRRMLKGVGSRAKQRKFLEEKGLIMAATDGQYTRGAATAKQLNTSMSEAMHERFLQMQGTQTRVQFINQLLDRYEHYAAHEKRMHEAEARQGDGMSPQMREVEKLILAHHIAIGAKDVVTTVHNLIHVAKAGEERINALKVAQDRCAELERALAKAKASPPVSVAAVAPREETQNILFGFVSALTGMTAVALSSGKIGVTLPDGASEALFSLWSQACSTLELSTPGATAPLD